MGEETDTRAHNEEPRTRPARSLKRAFLFLSSAGLMVAVGAGVFVVTGIAGAEGGDETPTPTPTETATPTSTPGPVRFFPTSPAAPVAETPPPPPPPRETRTLPMGPITGDRAVVHTGDGDCLNVRPVPSKQFDSDPRFCLNEGEIVYLYGEAIEADGEVWRYALGRGWLATRYVRMEAGVPQDPLGGFGGVILSSWTYPRGDNKGLMQYTRMDAEGQLHEIGAVDFTSWGIGWSPPLISPDGRYAAHTYSADGTKFVLRVEHLESGSRYEVSDVAVGAWSRDGRLLVHPAQCWEVDCPWNFGVFDTNTGEVTKYTIPGEAPAATTWLPDSSGVIAVADCKRIYRVDLDGTVTKLGEQRGERTCFGGMQIAPDGSFALAGSVYGPLMVVDLANGSAREFGRATRIVEPAGKCGGSVGNLTDVLDGGRIIYHESLAAKGSNGITIGDVATGERRVLSFWNIGDIGVIGPDRVTFTSYEQMNDLTFQLTWLLDTTTGEARPVAVGTEAGWVR